MKHHTHYAHACNLISYVICCDLFFVLLFVPCHSFAQPKALPVNIETLTVEDGLSQSVVYSIAQDSKGFIWMATFNGLDRYDGNGFVHFRHQPGDSFSISSNEVSVVYEDSRQQLWAGTSDNGLNYFDPVYRRFYHFFPGQKIVGLAEDSRGNLYVNRGNTLVRMAMPGINGGLNEKGAPAISGTAVFRLQDAAFNIDLPGMLLYADHLKNLFVTTRNGLFSLAFDTVADTFSFTKLLGCHTSVAAMPPQWLEDRRRGRYYILTDSAVLGSDNSRFSHPVKVHDGIPSYTNTFIDDSSRLWYTGRETNILFDLATQRDKVFASGIEHPGYDFGHLTPKLQDASGTIWLATAGNGIITYSDEENRFHSLLPGVFVNNIKAVSHSEVLAGNAWLFRADKPGAGLRRLTDAEAARLISFSFPRDSSGTSWCMSKDNLSITGHRPNGATKRISPIRYPGYQTVRALLPAGSGLPARDTVYSTVCPGYLFLDRDACLWLYARNGFLYYDTRADTYHFKSIDHFGNGNDYQKRMYEDASGTVWISISGGVCAYSKTTGATRLFLWQQDDDVHSLADKSITSFCDDPANPQRFIWIGTRNGLSRMDKQTGACRNFTEKDGLPSNIIYTILPERRGNLWMSTNNGLCRLHTLDFTIRNFTVGDGLQGSEFNGGAGLSLDNGIFVFGGTRGLTYFDPGDIKPVSPPHTVITDCRLFGRSMNLDSATAGGKDIAYAGDIRISCRDNIVSFSFTGTDYRRLHSLHYRYKLAPFDKNWNDAGTAHEATYTNLDPGDYTFVAEAGNTNGVWGKESRALILHVLPLWWQTWWFRLLEIAGAALCIFAFYRYHLQQITRLEKVRNNIARDLHDEIGSTLSTISIYSTIAQQQSGKPEANPILLVKKIGENAIKVMETMNDIVWSINTKNDTFENIFGRMQEHAVQLLELKGYALHFRFDEGIEHKKFELEKRKNFYLLYKEALNNIAKYAQGCNVWIETTDKRSHLVMTIRDDGKGFDIDKIKKSGNGLTNMQSRATSIGGEILMTSHEGKGTEVTVSIPYR